MAYIFRKYNGDAGHAGFQAQAPAGSLGRYSLSRIFHLPKKKKDIPDLPSALPTCEESIHYPVFNPRDPRHNPLAASKSWTTKMRSSQTASHRKLAQTGQILPTGSLRKARPDLMAVTAGIRNPPVNLERCLSGSRPAKPDLSTRAETFPASVSETSTQEDPDFGFDMHRTSCNLGRISHISPQDSSSPCTLKSYPSAMLFSPRLPAQDGICQSKSLYLKKPCQNQSQTTIGRVHQAEETIWVNNHIRKTSTIRDTPPAGNLLHINRLRIEDTIQDSSGSSTEVETRGSSGDGLLTFTLPVDSSSRLLDISAELAQISREISVTDEGSCPMTDPGLGYDGTRSVHLTGHRTAMLAASPLNISNSPSHAHKLPSYETTSITAPKDFC
ncbi:hypothetical protein VTN77DRAFT_3575 [Rasamsonia byssochlamydoides]|uniref:uncharacterized protein n=1 Tax=Rasamsonia byssochlamydoides TaxID=89139 RepID=UPI00374411A5